MAAEVFSIRDFWAAVESLDNQVPATSQMSMLIEARRLVERAARWLAQAHPSGIDIPELVARYSAGAQLVAANIPALLDDEGRELYEKWAAEFVSAGVPAELAARTASLPALLSTFDIVEVAAKTGHDPETVMLHQLPGHLPPAAQLAAQSHPRAAAQRPLADAGPFSAA